MQLFNLLKQAQANNGPNENQGHKNLDKKEETDEEFIAEGQVDDVMDKGSVEGIPNEDQHGVPIEEQIVEVDALFEETKLSQDDAVYESEVDQEEEEDLNEQMDTDGNIRMQDSSGTNALRNMQKGAPNNSGPQCIFAPDLVDTTSPEHRTTKNRDYSPESPERQEIDIYNGDPVVTATDGLEVDITDQRAVHHFRYESNFKDVPTQVMHSRDHTNDIPDVNMTHVSVATFDGKAGSERRSIDKQTMRSSQMNSPTRSNVKSHFKKANARDSHKQMPVDNSDAQDYLLDSKRDIANAFDVADQSPLVNDFNHSGEQKYFGQDNPNTQWHDVQIVETEDGGQELVIENLENLQNTTALVVTRLGNKFKIGIAEDAVEVSETASQKANMQGSQASLQQKLKFRGIFNKRPTDTLTENNIAVGTLQSRESNSKALEMTNQISNTEMQNKFKTFQDPLPVGLSASGNFREPVSIQDKSDGVRDSRDSNYSKRTHQSVAHGSGLEEELNYVKVIDPQQNKNNNNDKRDQNDSKLGKKLRVTSKRNSAATGDGLRDLTGRANSSLNSRQVNPSTLPPALRDSKSPVGSNHRSHISIRLQDKLHKTQHSVNSSLSDASRHLKLKVNSGRNGEKSHTGQKSPNNNIRAEERSEREFAQRIEEQDKEINQVKEIRLTESGEGLDNDSRFQLQDQPSRISIVSRQSNTDMKGADLVKYANRTVRESDHEESPDRQSDMNVMNAEAEEELKQSDPGPIIEMKQADAINSLTQSKESLARPESLNQPMQPIQFETMRADVAEQNHSVVDEPQITNQSIVQKNIERSVRSSKKILYSKSSKKSLLNKSVESLPAARKSELPSSTSSAKTPSKQETPVKPETQKSKITEAERPMESKKLNVVEEDQLQKKSIKSKSRKSKLSEERENQKDDGEESVRRSDDAEEKPIRQTSKPNSRLSQSEAKAVNIRKVRSKTSIKTLEPSRASKILASDQQSRQDTVEMNKTFQSSEPQSQRRTNRVRAVGAVAEKVAPKVLKGEQSEKHKPYRAPSSVKEAAESETTEMIAADKGVAQAIQKSVPQSVQSRASRQSRQSRIQPEAQSSANYHTTTEDNGENYFPQIMKYTETGPQESLLSRDHYSTSNAGASMISRKEKTQRHAKPIDAESVKNVPASGDYLKKLEQGKEAVKEDEAPGRSSRQSQHRKKPSVERNISKTITKEKTTPKAFLQQASRVEASHPQSESVLSQSNKEEDKFRTTGQDSLSPVAEEDRHNSKSSLVNVEPSNQNVTPSVTPTYNLDSSNFGQEVGLKPENRYQNQKEKIPARGKVPAIHMDAVNAAALSPRESHESRALANGQGSRGSLHSKKSKKERLPSLNQSMYSSSKQSKSKEPLRSSGRMNANANRKRDMSNTLPKATDIQGSRKNPFPGKRDLQDIANPNSSIEDGQNIKQQFSNNPSDFQTSQRSGRKPNNLATGSILPAVVQKPPMGQRSIQAAAMRNSGYNDSQASRPRQNRAHDHNNSQFEDPEGKPIMKYMEASDSEQKSYPLKYFKGQDLELYYMEKQLKPGVEREIKEGFFEIRKKFGEQAQVQGEEVQVYVSHLCLHNYHPIFCKFNLDVVKTILNFSQIIYLKKGQTLYQQGFNDRYLYVILFGKLRLSQPETDQMIGQPLNIGWTVGEEILFKSDKKAFGGQRLEKCQSLCESCVLGIEKRSLAQIKRTLVEKGQAEEFVKLEVVLRGNYLVKKAWRQ